MSKIQITNAHVLMDGTFKERTISIEDGVITAIGEELPGASHLDAEGLFLLPGFIDIHTHGAVGVDFNHAEREELSAVSAFLASCGVTSYLPTVLTDTTEVMMAKLDLLSDPAVLAANPTMAAIHLEGPFLNVRYKGAMAEHLLRTGDVSLFRELFAASRGRIRLITVAPEVEGMLPVIEEAVSLGVRVSMGHSEASYEETMRAIDAGAVSTTHTMNAMKLLHMHDPAILTAVLESDIWAEMIADGFHLHPPIIRLLLKTKGWRRMIATTDSISAAGYPDGEYQLGPNAVIVEHGDAKLVENGVRAGSTLTMDRAMRNLLSFTGRDLSMVSPLLSTNAAEMLGFNDRGSVAVGMRADLVGIDQEHKVRLTIAGGTTIFKG